jgi:hypothetical protein
MAVLESAVSTGRSLEEVAGELGRSLNAVRIRRQRFFPTSRDLSRSPGWQGGSVPGGGRYWTSERIDEGLRDFARRHRGPLPTSDHVYNALKVGHMEWPTGQAVLELHGTMADAWGAIGAPKSRYNRGWVPWTQADDDFLLEHAGSQTLKVIAKQMGRSWAACKRRLYDLGAGRARDVSGYMSAMQVAAEYKCPVGRVEALIRRGELRARKVVGGHYWRIDPEDLAEVEAKLRAPKRTHRKARVDLGDYRLHYGYRRVPGADGKVRQVAVTAGAVERDRVKATRKEMEEAKRRAVRLLEERGQVVDLGMAS